MSHFGWMLGVGVVLLQGCAGRGGSEDEGGTGSSGGADTTTTGGGVTDGGVTDGGDTEVESSAVPLSENKAVDVLFVIDNSGSMAEEQALLAQNFAAFLSVLEKPTVNANYRIGITTTDAGNPRCPSSTPENGTLVLSSCLDRVASGEFSFGVDDYSFACTDFCATADADLKVQPTTTQYDDQPAPRKWIERTEGVSNIAGVDSNVDAFRCYGPQGVAGCGFESHLESMYKALAKAQDQGSPANYGFMREAAILSIVVLSDETDCSYQQAGKDIFIGNKVYWNDPSDPQPTSALCWRAGVECSGQSPYSECHAANWGLDGSVGVADADAVLSPVSEYIAFVKSIEDAKRDYDPNQRVVVAMINGVPVGYDRREAELVYEDSLDGEYQDNFGIGPGCVLGDPQFPDTSAVPPVREREFAEAFADPKAAERNLHSICQQDYSDALGAVADQIAAQIVPTCMPLCVRDTNLETALLDPSCLVYEESLEGVRSEVPPCKAVGGLWTAPAGATICYAALTDPQLLTPTALDDMTPYCSDRGFNLEFQIVRTVPAAPGARLSAECILSDDKQRDCPLL